MVAYKPRLSVTMLRKNHGWNRISILPTSRSKSRLSDARIVSRMRAAVESLFQKCMARAPPNPRRIHDDPARAGYHRAGVPGRTGVHFAAPARDVEPLPLPRPL